MVFGRIFHLNCKNKARLIRLPRVKYFNVFCPFLRLRRKKEYDIGPRLRKRGRKGKWSYMHTIRKQVSLFQINKRKV
jgi:hypothetical protein